MVLKTGNLMDTGEKKYTNGEITIVWKPQLCIHSRKCFTGLAAVFDPAKKPWINMSAASTSAIVAQVKKCPSAALSFFFNDEGVVDESVGGFTVEVLPNGPLVTSGNFTVIHKDGRKEFLREAAAFCRCGGSKNKPFCDGSHELIDFE